MFSSTFIFLTLITVFLKVPLRTGRIYFRIDPFKAQDMRNYFRTSQTTQCTSIIKPNR